MRRRLAIAGGAAALLLAAGAGLSQTAGSPPAAPSPAGGRVQTPPELFTRPLPPGTPEQVVRGRYLTIAGDCAACHTRSGKPPFSGGRGLQTPFGTIYTPNLTGDAETGMGGWSPDQFWRALHEGRDDVGKHLYPAFPYPYFTRVTRADSDAILAYLKTVPPVHFDAPRNALPFPFDIRALVAGWNLLFFRPAEFRVSLNRSADYNRGAYLVETLGHCGACHTPKNPLGADVKSRAYQGGKLENWFAPNLTGAGRVGLGRWSAADIAEYLKTGRNSHAQATGAMAEVISDSTSLMSDADLKAMAVYLKGIPAAGGPQNAQKADSRAMTVGRAVYEDQCAACHRMAGQGVPRFFPPLAGHPDVQARDPNNVVRVILEGARTAPSPTRPTPLSMPSYAWQLNDRQIADVATYIRQSWGNRAAPVADYTVAGMRRRLHVGTGAPSSWSRQ